MLDCTKTIFFFQWKQEKPYTFQLSRISIGLNLIFVAEVMMKLIAFTPRGYWQSRRNRYDLFVTIMGANWIFVNYHLEVRGLLKSPLPIYLMFTKRQLHLTE